LNQKRDQISKNSIDNSKIISRKFALFGYQDTTTVRVYMREIVSKIVAELFFSNYSIVVENVNPVVGGKIDKDHGYVVFSVKATRLEIEMLLDYIKPGASFYVYDGHESKYSSGDTSNSEFIITKINDTHQPKKFWRRSRAFIARIKELPPNT